MDEDEEMYEGEGSSTESNVWDDMYRVEINDALEEDFEGNYSQNTTSLLIATKCTNTKNSCMVVFRGQ